jgi:regulator of protease activity HflC (stomatin/prohibitin superfamily)
MLRFSFPNSRNQETHMSGFNPRVYEGSGNPGPMAAKIVLVVIALFLVVIFAFMSFTTIGAGNVGVLTLFGKVYENERLDAGFHFVNPLKSVHEITVRTQSVKESAEVPSSEGLVMKLDTSVVFHVNPDKAATIYKELGPDFIDVIIEPTVRSAVRETTASHSANALYSSARETVAKQILDSLQMQLKPRGIEIEQVLLRDIQLPEALKASIELKQQAEQESLAMSFKLQKERQEAERKRIEAQGIRDFQQTVSQGISNQLLEWKGIEATQLLANSPNTKVVVIGNSKNGLPLILGQ